MDLQFLSIVAGAIVGPILTALLKRLPVVRDSGNDGLGAAINVGVCLVVFVLLGAFLPLAYPELPKDLTTWVKAGLAAAGLGGGMHNVWRKKLSPPKEIS